MDAKIEKGILTISLPISEQPSKSGKTIDDPCLDKPCLLPDLPFCKDGVCLITGGKR